MLKKITGLILLLTLLSPSLLKAQEPNYYFRCQGLNLKDAREPAKITLKDLSVYYYHFILHDGVDNVQGALFAYELSGYWAEKLNQDIHNNKEFEVKLRNAQTLNESIIRFVPNGVTYQPGKPARSLYTLTADHSLCGELDGYCEDHSITGEIELGQYLCHTPWL